MISVYYNQKYGFLIVPNAIERFMGCYISIEPTIEIMAEETIDKIGCAIRKGIKIAESSPKVDESQLNNFWKQTKYKSFPTFSKNYQRIDLKQNGDELEILVPRELEPVKFTIDKLWDIETDEEIDTVNPGKQGQQVKMILPIKAEENWIIRRKK